MEIIVIEVGESTIGMVVDSCNEVMRLSGDQIEAAPDIITKKIDADYIEGVGILEERLIILLDLAKVLGGNEVEAVAKIGEKQQARTEKEEETKTEKPKEAKEEKTKEKEEK